jgi:hypothetical protein
VEKSRAALDERLNELYRESPERFVAGRDELAKELRAAGDRDESARVKKLRRPSVPAWLLNRAALKTPDRLEEFDRASRELAGAQERALAGEADAAAGWRQAAARERDAAGAVVDAAGRLAREARHPASDRALELVGETLRAASGDAELRERVLSGRLEREQSAATLGNLGAGPPPNHRTGSSTRAAKAPKRNANTPKRAPKAPKQPDLVEARRERDRLQRKLAAADAREERSRAQVDEAVDALRERKASLAAAKRETADLRREVKAAERRARG